MEQRQNGSGSQSRDKGDVRQDEGKGRKSNHVSMLQRNERQFYDNLLVSVSSFAMYLEELLFYRKPLNLGGFFCQKACINALTLSTK